MCTDKPSYSRLVYSSRPILTHIFLYTVLWLAQIGKCPSLNASRSLIWYLTTRREKINFSLYVWLRLFWSHISDSLQQLYSTVCVIVCARDGRLHAGDELLMINGQSLVGRTHQEAVAILRSTTGLVQLVVASKVTGHTHMHKYTHTC